MKSIYLPKHLKAKLFKIDNGNYQGFISQEIASLLSEEELVCPDLIFERESTRMIKSSRNILAEVVLGDGEMFVFKKYPNRGLTNRLKYSLRQSKAARGWNKAFWILEKGIKTPKPLLALEKKRFGALVHSFLLVEKIGNATQLRAVLKHFRKGNSDWREIEKSDFLGRLARFVGSMHKAGMCHRDLSGGNVLVTLEDGSPQFSIVDINRSRFSESITIPMRLKDLERINIEPDDRLFFLEQYCNDERLFVSLKDEYQRRIERYRKKRE